jgi:hypothetical protein
MAVQTLAGGGAANLYRERWRPVAKLGLGRTVRREAWNAFWVGEPA